MQQIAIQMVRTKFGALHRTLNFAAIGMDCKDSASFGTFPSKHWDFPQTAVHQLWGRHCRSKLFRDMEFSGGVWHTVL